MATTKIWKVSSRVDDVIKYADNKEKTLNPKFSEPDLQAINDVIGYASNEAKTEKQYYVTGVNCNKHTAFKEMQLVKTRFGKTDKILAWHGCQSFAPGEVDAETAHEIGVKLAKVLWSDFQVVVATHLNTNSFHNHFVLNSVSFVTGKKFYGNKVTYRKMRDESDKLCREYGLSVIENKKKEYTQSYTEWKAENEGRPTWRSAIRQDVDKAIGMSISFQAFIRNMQTLGYEVKTGVKHIAVKPKGKERFVRLRSLGDNYTENAIRDRIMEKFNSEKPQISKPVKRVRLIGTFTQCHKFSWNGFRALYYYYLHKLKKAKDNPNDLYLIREDLRLMDKLSAHAKFLNQHKIDSLEELTAYNEWSEKQIKVLCIKRKTLRNKERRVNLTDEEKINIKAQISSLSDKIKDLRRDVFLCSEIRERSEMLKEKVKQINEIKREELNKDALRRGRGGKGR